MGPPEFTRISANADGPCNTASRQNRSFHCEDIAIFRIFKMTAAAIISENAYSRPQNWGFGAI